MVINVSDTQEDWEQTPGKPTVRENSQSRALGHQAEQTPGPWRAVSGGAPALWPLYGWLRLVTLGSLSVTS